MVKFQTAFKLVIVFTLLTIIVGCSSTRFQPCCRIYSGYGGFERHKTVRLKVDKIDNMAKYETETYLILMDKKALFNTIKNQITDKVNYESILSNTLDTLDIKSIELGNDWHRTKAVVRQINRGKAIIIVKSTGQRLTKVKRRKFNYQTGPRSGRGGIEYSDLNNNYVIIGLAYWVS